MTIQYLAPIFTAIIGIFALREKVKSAQWVFYALAFAGVLLVEQFDSRVSYLYLFFGILSAFCSGVAYNLVQNSARQRTSAADCAVFSNDRHDRRLAVHNF